MRQVSAGKGGGVSDGSGAGDTPRHGDGVAKDAASDGSGRSEMDVAVPALERALAPCAPICGDAAAISAGGCSEVVALCREHELN